jgi:hypothetical protein
MTASMRLGTVAVLTLALAGSAWAQTEPPPLKNEQGRGVRVLKAEDPSASSSSPSASPAVTPPAPAQVVKPTPAALPKPIIKLCERPFATTDVRWDGQSGTDRALAQRLRTGQRVVVDLAQPYPEAAQPPAGLSRWLTEVQKGGGAVTVKQYCKSARGGLGSWLAKLGESLGGGSLYRPARQYDVLLHSDALDRVVTQVEFVPKAVAS